jgi:DnaK suppressor protein
MKNHFSYEQIRLELIEAKHEMEQRLKGLINETKLTSIENSKMNQYAHILQSELKDINVSLNKMQKNCYGICERTGQSIPLDYLKYVPTARTCEEATFNNGITSREIDFNPHVFKNIHYHTQ